MCVCRMYVKLHGVQIDLVKGMMECLYATCTPCITECVMAELEKLGQKYRVALKIAKDPRIKRLPCAHTGTYADDCICERVTKHRCYIVATCDKDLRRRLRKVHMPASSFSTSLQFRPKTSKFPWGGSAPLKFHALIITTLLFLGAVRHGDYSITTWSPS